MSKIKHYRNYGKSQRYQNRVGRPNELDDGRVFRVVQAHRLEGRLEAVPEVKGNHDHANHVENHKAQIREGFFNQGVEVSYFFAVNVHQFNTVADFAVVHHRPKLDQVDDEEHKNNGAVSPHVLGHYRIGLRSSGFCYRITLCATGAPIFYPKKNAQDGMQQNEEEIPFGNELNQWVVAHEISVDVEGFTIVVVEQLEVSSKVYHQKKDKENARQGHQKFLANGRSEKSKKPIVHLQLRFVDVFKTAAAIKLQKRRANVPT